MNNRIEHVPKILASEEKSTTTTTTNTKYHQHRHQHTAILTTANVKKLTIVYYFGTDLHPLNKLVPPPPR